MAGITEEFDFLCDIMTFDAQIAASQVIAVELRRTGIVDEMNGAVGRNFQIVSNFFIDDSAVHPAKAQREGAFRRVANVYAVIHDIDGQFAVSHRVAGDDDRLELPFHFVVEGFAPSVVVDAAPRGDGPAVVELPHQRAHTVRTAAAMLLQRHPDAVGLYQLTDIHVIFQIVRTIEILVHRLVDNLNATGVLLVVVQFGTSEVQGRVGHHRLQRAEVGVALEAVFRHEAAGFAVPHFERLLAPPNAPVVGVALGAAFGMSPTPQRRSGDVWHATAKIFNDFC